LGFEKSSVVEFVLKPLSRYDNRLEWAQTPSKRLLLKSEMSRRLSDEVKARHPEIPWQKVAATRSASYTSELLLFGSAR
jgi:uncharacterized protein with HEPN domain